MGRGELFMYFLDKLIVFLESNNLFYFFNLYVNLLEGLNVCDISFIFKELKRV